MAKRVITHNAQLGVPFAHAIEVEPAAEVIRQTASEGKIHYPNGPELWRQLHLRAIEREGSDDSEWIKAFAVRLPCGDCRRHWNEMIETTPPDFNHYFEWTVYIHNSVNLRLGKPVLTVDQAKPLYS